MIIVPIIIIIGLIISTRFIKTEIISKKIVITYSIIMCLTLGISMFNPVGLYNVSNYTYILLIMNIVLVAFSILVTSKLIIKKEEKKQELDCDKIIKSKGFCIVEICECIILIYYLIKYFNVIENIHPSQIRIARFTLLFDSAFETLFYNYIISGIVSISSLIFSILLVKGKVKNIPFIIITINIILFSIIGFGRMTIFSIIITIFFVILLFKDLKNIVNKKNIIKIIILLLITFLVCSIMILIRMDAKEDALIKNIFEAFKEQFTQIFEYFLGGIRMLDKYVNNGFTEFKGYTYGRASFAGIEEIILYPFKGMGLEIDSFNNIADNIMSESQRIGENTPYYNAFYTGIMNFYLDFGVFGVVLFSILHGVLISITIKHYIIKKNISSLMLLIFVLNNLILTILSWGYQSGSTTFVLIILILGNTIENKIERNKLKNENTMDC